MDEFPSVTDLVNGSKSNIGITARWDVVVSYSLDSLNSILRQLWTNNITSTAIELVTESLNEDDEVYHTQWWLRLGAPTLSFTSDGKASLRMPLDGKRQVLGNKSNGEERPVHEIPPGRYSLYAVIPLATVSARAGSGSNGYKVEGASGQVIKFEKDPNAELHVVLNFQTTQEDGAVYSVRLSPGQEESSVPDSFSVGLRNKLAAWMSDPANVSSIQYSLAMVNNKPVENAVYLTPEAMTFKVFKSPNRVDVACLSVYMKTKGSDAGPGDPIPSFVLPAKNNQSSFPIPRGYTASIIIHHNLFIQKFLADTMKASKEDGKPIFTSVTPEPSKEGLKLKAFLNVEAMNFYGNAEFFGGSVAVDRDTWDLAASELSLTIQDSKGSWSYLFEKQIRWSFMWMGDKTWGKINCEIKLNKEGLSLFEDASDVGLRAQIKVKEGDWQITRSNWKPGFIDTVGGARETPPAVVEKGFNKIKLPPFSAALALQYFATTNIFAPGKHMLSIAGASEVYTPYDVIILGNVRETAG